MLLKTVRVDPKAILHRFINKLKGLLRRVWETLRLRAVFQKHWEWPPSHSAKRSSSWSVEQIRSNTLSISFSYITPALRTAFIKRLMKEIARRKQCNFSLNRFLIFLFSQVCPTMLPTNNIYNSKRNANLSGAVDP